jgi:dihydrofolate reductase
MMITSLDGYVADEDGKYDWAMPDEEVFGFINDFERPIGTYLYGRRLYEDMTGWETTPQAGQSPLMLDFARIWRAADKVVFSRSLEAVGTARTRIERDFDPAAIQQMKARADRDITVGGPVLAAEALKAGLVDECHLIVCPVSVGGGKKSLPSGVRLAFELLAERRFANGAVYLRYASRS